MKRVLVGVVMAGLIGWPAALADAAGGQGPSQAHPKWSMSNSKAVTNSKLAVSTTSWSCHGSAFPPFLAQDAKFRNYIGYTASQTCGGGFFVQKVCVDLQRRDYFGHYATITTTVCSVTSTNVSITKSGTVMCSAAGHGTYRAHGHGYAQEPFVGTSEGWSASETLC